ncbi:LPS export ABC transporter permease LptF [Candidatus Vallotiella sp. (ex Adelges kitamiensis)]|uniref:LPS export ABC transporter permease LptF n=1 Tax=Candidatus Vallotiella sp. (ex Adelges kitamiensis) TaxID=2864217 RepID=UPI001CE2F54A|nr:LPS export ABC transporter permease LptF [Candidatus Vallotia sp. (ex Adelges kitamiensis)]
MILERSLQRELAYTGATVFFVLLTLVLTTMMIRIVGFAALGEIDPSDVIVLISLTMISYVAVMLIASLFASILFVLTRWYRDSEMLVWFSCGVSLTRLIKPILTFSIPIVALISFFAFVGWPWANAQSKLIRERFQQRDEISLLAPGQFRESASKHRVFFIEKASPDQKRIENIFVTSTENGRVNVLVSKIGYMETHPNGDRFVVLKNGRRYDGNLGQIDFRIMEFSYYGIKIQSEQLVNRPMTTSLPTTTLLSEQNNTNLAEFVWRASLPLTAINLMLLAIPLAYQNPRHGYTINLVLAVLIYLTYSNLMNLVQAWVEQGVISFVPGLLGLHLIMLAIVIFAFWLRVRNRLPLWHLLLRIRSRG